MILSENFWYDPKPEPNVMADKPVTVSLITLESCRQSAMATQKWAKLELKAKPASNTRVIKDVKTFSMPEGTEDSWNKTFPSYIKQVPCIIRSYGDLIEVYPHILKPLEPIDEQGLNEWLQTPFVVNPF